jgi:hypothetical protein
MTSWGRKHGKGTAMALAIWLNGRYEASVYEDPKSPRVPDRVPCDSEDEAKARAEELLKGAYPHDCAAAGCDPWAMFVRPALARGL